MIHIETVTGHPLQQRINKLIWDAELFSQKNDDPVQVARFIRLTFNSIVNGAQIRITRENKEKLIVDLRD